MVLGIWVDIVINRILNTGYQTRLRRGKMLIATSLLKHPIPNPSFYKEDNFMFNTAYMIAVVSRIGEEVIVSGGIRRALIKVRCYDSKGDITEGTIMLSELGELRKSTGLSVGDVIFFAASLSEGVKDSLVFRPHDIYILRKGFIPAEELSDRLIDAKLLPYKEDHNIVVLDGRVSVIEKENICLIVENQETLRGDSSSEFHIWVVSTDKKILKSVKVGQKATFIGELSKGKLKGKVFAQ